MPKVFVSIINFNGKKDTLKCLQSVNELNKKGFDLSVVVLDNGSKEPFETDRKYNFDLKIIRSDRNLGFSGGQNLGIKYALGKEADFVLILNNDVTLDKDLIKNLLSSFDNGNYGLVSPKIYFEKGKEFHKGLYKENDLGKVIWYAGGVMDWQNVIGFHRGVDQVDKGQFDKAGETDFVSGCCMLVKKEVFEKVGLFVDKYFLYYEDNDLSQRAKKEGFSSFYEPKGFLWHDNAGSAGGSGSSLQDYYITRNRLLFGTRYASLRAKTALIKESIMILLKGRKWQKKGVLDFYTGKMGKGSYE